MSAGTIYTVQPDGTLVRMRPGAPASEDQMQLLVARYPELIGDADGALLLIRREQPVADALEAPGRWSLDHLFVTRGGIPVLVELKRAADTRLRREIVGQLLDYAANSVAYWEPNTIANAFATTCAAAGIDADSRLTEFLGKDDAADFWEQVDANFHAGRVKLVFVADSIPRELIRIVEFLNEQMRADVRAIELKWYGDEIGTTTLVPRIFGETERAATQKSVVRKKLGSMGIEEWADVYIRPYGGDVVTAAYNFFDVIANTGGELAVQSSQKSVSASFARKDGGSFKALFLYPNHIELPLGNLVNRPGLADEAARLALYRKFHEAVGPLSNSNLVGFPSIKLSVLADPLRKPVFADAVRDLVDAAA